MFDEFKNRIVNIQRERVFRKSTKENDQGFYIHSFLSIHIRVKHNYEDRS